MSARISGLIVAHNEASNIRYSLGSLLPWCDEVVVVDQESTDRTAEIAREMGARVVPHPKTGFVEAARQFAIDQTSGDWVIMLDADEMTPPSLAARLRSVAAGEPVDVVLIPRVNIVLGHWSRVSARNWPNRHPRFFRPGALAISDRIHEGLDLQPDARRLLLAAEPRLAIWHFSYESVEDMVEKFNRYTSVQARQALADGARQPSLWALLTSPTRWLWSTYVRQHGYRDGRAGLIVAIARGFYQFLLTAKIWDEAALRERMIARDAMRDRIVAAYAPRRDGDVERD